MSMYGSRRDDDGSRWDDHTSDPYRSPQSSGGYGAGPADTPGRHGDPSGSTGRYEDPSDPTGRYPSDSAGHHRYDAPGPYQGPTYGPTSEPPLAASAPPPAAPGRRPLLNRTTIIIAVLAVLLVGAGTAGAATLLSGNDSGEPNSAPNAAAPAGAGSKGASSPAAAAKDPISMSATGDVVMGTAPGGLPPNNGKGFFDQVAPLLKADFQMMNLEQTITDDTGVGKCSAESAGRTCFAFRTPPATAQNLKDAGTHLVNLANNHAWDYGATGMGDTVRALEARRIGYTGRPGEIRVRVVRGRQVAFVGFSTYPWSASMLDLAGVRALVAAAARRAPVVVAFFHGGAEGVARTRTPHGPERYLGEERGDVRAFAHAAIGAGADLVLGSGPHVLRGLELHRRRLIAYSLGNLAGGVFRTEGLLGVSAVLRVRLGPDGRFRGGRLFPLRLDASGVPHPDPTRTAARVVTALGAEDFPGHAVAVGPKGRLRRAPRGRTAA